MLLPIDRRVNDRLPIATFALIGVNTLCYLAVFLGADNARELRDFFLRYGAVPAALKPQMLLTHMFMHAGPDHLIGNMVFLAFFGMNVERRLGFFPYLLLYFLSGLSSIGLFLAVTPRGDVPLVGASGAISGVTGMYLALFARRIVDVWWIFGILKAPAFLFILFWIGMELVFALLLSNVVMVAHWAHVGGFLGGWLVLFVLLKLGFQGHAEMKGLTETKNLAESFTELKYIPLNKKVGPSEGQFALFFKHEGEAPEAARPLLPVGAKPHLAARGLTFPQAENLSRDLETAGLKTVIAPERSLVRLPEMQLANDLALDGVLAVQNEVGDRLERDPFCIYLLAAGKVQNALLLDLFVTSPWTDFRISNLLTSKDLQQLAAHFRKSLPDAFLEPGFRALSEGRLDLVPVHATQQAYDEHNQWVLQCLAVGMK